MYNQERSSGDCWRSEGRTGQQSTAVPSRGRLARVKGNSFSRQARRDVDKELRKRETAKRPFPVATPKLYYALHAGTLCKHSPPTPRPGVDGVATRCLFAGELLCGSVAIFFPDNGAGLAAVPLAATTSEAP